MIDRILREAFGSASPEHYQWQTTNPYVAEQERALIRSAFLPMGSRVLDIGCGEGATLFHLAAPAGAVGVDLFEEKLAFARAQHPAYEFVMGSADALPFENASFDHVLVRDVVHHLEYPERCIDECARVLVPGGRIDVLEPCRNNPLIVAHALSRRAERGELRSTLASVSRLVGRRFAVVERTRHQALPMHRIVLHPEFGAPDLARHAPFRACLGALERAAERWVPRIFWAYLHVRGTVRP